MRVLCKGYSEQLSSKKPSRERPYFSSTFDLARRQDKFQACNFEVGSSHTYFVSSAGVLLHNHSATPEGTAQEAYPNKPGDENHHITARYLGRANDDPTVPLDAANHQQITNEFRLQYPYGQGRRPDPAELQRIMEAVYQKYPLPPGTRP